MFAQILEINMTPRFADCFICGEVCEGDHGVPVFNGDIMSNDWQGEWGGQHVCESCFGKHERGEIETHDDLYEHHLEKYHFVAGSGI